MDGTHGNGRQADLLMRVDGMTCDGCAAAVTRVDPAAVVQVDRAGSRVAIHTGAQALVIAEALSKAGYPATAMTG